MFRRALETIREGAKVTSCYLRFMRPFHRLRFPTEEELSASRQKEMSFHVVHHARFRLYEHRYIAFCAAHARTVPHVLISRTLSLLQLRATSIFATAHRPSQVLSSVWPTTVVSLSHWASTIVYNTIGVTQRFALVHLRQRRLVLIIFYSPANGRQANIKYAIKKANRENLVCWML